MAIKAYASRTAGRYARDSSYYNKTAKDTAVQALKTARAVKKLLNVEYKLHDTIVSTDIHSTGTFTNLNSIAQGDDQVNRDGRSILLKSIHVRSSYESPAVATSGDYIRTMLIMDTDSQGTTPTITDILATNSTTSHRNITSDQGRFRVLYDSTKTMNSDHNRNAWQFNKKMNTHLKYDGGLASDYSENAIWLFQLSVQSTGANSTKQVTNVRLRFLDN